MTKTAVLLGGDRRQSCLARQLQACGFAVRTCGVPGCPDTAHTLPACVRGAELLILPMPALRAPDRIRAAPDAGIRIRLSRWNSHCNHPIPLYAADSFFAPELSKFGERK